MKVVRHLPVVGIDVEAKEIITFFIFELRRLLVELQRGKLLCVRISLQLFRVDEDGIGVSKVDQSSRCALLTNRPYMRSHVISVATMAHVDNIGLIWLPIEVPRVC